MLRALIGWAAIAFAAAPACAQPVTSAGPDSVAVTIYRSPHGSGEFDLRWLQGYALITEKRTITIPAGRATVRFEGVAGGILPESAIVTGLPEGVREKNLDADLLSPASLYAHSFGRPVTIRRTVAKQVIEEPAIIRSGPAGSAILETKDGFVAANCAGQPEELVYGSVPAGLSPKPTLSIETDSPAARQVTVTLSYLAWGFDWQANYVATMRPDGKSADLFAWVTLANGDVTSFADAETMVVAGRVNREDDGRRDAPDGGSFSFTCFAHPIVTAEDIGAFPNRSVADALQRVPGVEMNKFEGAIVVTGIRASQEDLGDLKLYRLPERTTVAAMSQKQVAMLDRPAVPVSVIYRAQVLDDEAEEGVAILLRAQNRKEDGLGLPLPSGGVTVFEPLGERRILVGEGHIADKAVNEEVEVEAADATQVVAKMSDGDSGGDWEEHILTVTNANPFAIRFEAELQVSDSYKRTRASARLGRHRGRDVWAVDVPANGTATFKYRLKDLD